MATCRICLEDADPEADLAPCACKGSVRFVHRACLERWAVGRDSDVCDICTRAYTVPMSRRTALQESHLAAGVYFLLFVMSILDAAYEEYYGIHANLGHMNTVLLCYYMWDFARSSRDWTRAQRETLMLVTTLLVTGVYMPQVVADAAHDRRGRAQCKLGFALTNAVALWRHTRPIN